MRLTAFSILEVLITVTVIALLTITAFPPLAKLERRQQFVSTLSLMKNCFWQAKALAKAPRVQAVTAYQALYQDTVGNSMGGCQIQEEQAGGLVTMTDFKFPTTSYRLTDVNGNYLGSTKITVKVSTDPPYDLEITQGGSSYFGITVGFKDTSDAALVDTFNINQATGNVE